MNSLDLFVSQGHRAAVQKCGDALTKSLASNHSKNAPPGDRVATPQRVKDSKAYPQGGLSKHFTIADYRKLEKLATAEPFEGWLKFFEVAKRDRIGDQRRWKLSVWDGAEGCYRVIAGQFFKPEIDWIKDRYRETRDKGRFAVAIEIWLQRAIEACSSQEVAA